MLGSDHQLVGDIYKQLGVTYLAMDYSKVAENYYLSYIIQKNNTSELSLETIDRHFRWLENEYRALCTNSKSTNDQYVLLVDKMTNLNNIMYHYSKNDNSLEVIHNRVGKYISKIYDYLFRT